MKFYIFNKDSGKKVSKSNWDFIMSRIIQTDKITNIGCMHLDRKGIYCGLSSSGSASTTLNFKWRGLCP